MKLESVEQVAMRRLNGKAALQQLLSSPVGKDVLYILANELNVDSLIGVDTHDTYYRLGKYEALQTIKRLGEFND